MTNSNFNNPASQQNSETIGTVYNAAIQPKMNSTAGVEPLPTELVDGEIAVNTADGKLFVKNIDGTIKEISGAGGGGSSVGSYTVTTNSAEPVPPPNDFYYFTVAERGIDVNGTGAKITDFTSGGNNPVMDQIDEFGRDLRDNPLWMNIPEGYPYGRTTIWVSADGGTTWQNKVQVDLGLNDGFADTIVLGLDVNSPDFPEMLSGIGLEDAGNPIILTLIDPATTADPPIPSYLLAGPGLPDTGFVGNKNPDLYVTRGQTYEFSNTMGAHPFQIQLSPGIGGVAYNAGIENNPASNDILEWVVALDAPDTLYYQSTTDATMGGVINVLIEADYTTIEVYDDVTNVADTENLFRFKVVATNVEVLEDGDQASMRLNGVPVESNDYRAIFSDVDMDGKPFLASPALAGYDVVNDAMGTPYFPFWFSIDNGVTWYLHGPLQGFGRAAPGEGYGFFNFEQPIRPVWDGASEVLVYVGNAPGPVHRAPNDKDLLVYKTALSAFKPGQTSIINSSDFALQDAPRVSFTYTLVFARSGDTYDGWMNIKAVNALNNNYYVRFDYSYFGDCCTNNVYPIIESANVWETETGSKANQPFWLTDEFTGITTSHFGTFASLGGGQLRFDEISGDTLPTGFLQPAKFTISVLDPTAKIPLADGDRLTWNETLSTWQPQRPTSVNGQTGVVELAAVQLTDVVLAPFTNFYYYTSTDSAENVNGGSLALITTAEVFSSTVYMTFDSLDENGRDIKLDPAYNPSEQKMWVSTDNGVTWNINNWYNYGTNPLATNPDGTCFFGLVDENDPMPALSTSGIAAIIALQDPTVGAIPSTGEALVATQIDYETAVFIPTEIITMGQIKTAAALSTDFADFQTRIAAL